MSETYTILGIRVILQGIVHLGRHQLSAQKAWFARSQEEGLALEGASLCDVVQQIYPTSLIGAAAQANSFSPEVLSALEQALPFTLS